MKTLILSDLHYEHDNPPSRKQLDKLLKIDGDFDAVILGGDNAELSSEFKNHRILFKKLKERFRCPGGFVIGNHELWGKIGKVSSLQLLNELFPRVGEEYGFTYLEKGNLEVGGITYVGTYGHYDYSFLRKGNGVTMEDLLKGTFKIENRKIIWQDKTYMDWEGQSDEEVCAEIIKKFGERIKTANRPISISHTIPGTALNGWPDSREQYFLEPYSGSNLLGDVLEANGGEYHFCGHTHVKAKDTIGKTTVINLGSDLNQVKYVILKTDENKITIKENETAPVK